MKRRRLIREWIGFFIVFLGFLIIAWPFLSGRIAEREQKKTLEKIKTTRIETEKQKEAVRESLSDDREIEAEEVPGEEEEKEDPLYKACLSYNEALFREGQDYQEEEDFAHFSLDLTGYGYEEQLFGTIWIPRMEVELPLFLGTGEGHMARGAAVFGETSLPIGESKSANTAIAGHRGYRGTPMFRDIQKLRIGDRICIETPFEKLVYRVFELRIVSPEDSSWCSIQEGRNLVSLMTCHPYTLNYERYIVLAELSDEEYPGPEEKEPEGTEEGLQEVIDLTEGERRIVTVDTVTIEPDGTEYGAVWSNGVILAEKQMKGVLLAAGSLVLILFIRLVRRTGKDWKRS